MIASNPILLARFSTINEPRKERVGLVNKDEGKIYDLTGVDVQGITIKNMQQILNWVDRVAKLRTVNKDQLTSYNVSEVKLKSPVPNSMPAWAVGVTYNKSRMERGSEQSTMEFTKPRANLSQPGGKNAYDLVYDQDPNTGRPELFFKAPAGAVVGTRETIGIRPDSEADVPEPELVLILNDKGELAGYSIGNDVSSRDIEGQNPLYLPQAKVYAHSGSIGPYIQLADDSNTEAKIKDTKSAWKVNMKVIRNEKIAYQGDTEISGIKNSFDNLISHLQKSQHLPKGAALFTGTGIIPPNDFKLEEGDIVRISIGSLGTLENVVKKLPDGPVLKEDIDELNAFAAQQDWSIAI